MKVTLAFEKKRSSDGTWWELVGQPGSECSFCDSGLRQTYHVPRTATRIWITLLSMYAEGLDVDYAEGLDVDDVEVKLAPAFDGYRRLKTVSDEFERTYVQPPFLMGSWLRNYLENKGTRAFLRVEYA